MEVGKGARTSDAGDVMPALMMPRICHGMRSYREVRGRYRRSQHRACCTPARGGGGGGEGIWVQVTYQTRQEVFQADSHTLTVCMYGKSRGMHLMTLLAQQSDCKLLLHLQTC